MSRSARFAGNGCRSLTTSSLPSFSNYSAPITPAGPSKPSRTATAIPVLRLETASVLFAIAKDVGEALQHVPYVKALCGVMLQIIKIKEEITDSKWRCKELVEKVERRSEVILLGLKKISEAPGRDGLKDLEDDLVAYHRLLQDVHNILLYCASKKMSHRVDRWLNRGQLWEDMLRLERLLDDFRVNFSDNRLVHIEIQMNTMSNLLVGKTRGLQRHRPLIPPEPPFLYGRERERAAIIATLTGSASPRIAILGAGGIGKTTLAISCLYDKLVVERYESRYFVACDGVTSAELLLTELANVLRLPRDQLDENMHDIVLSAFRRTATVICFDNFETAWDNATTRRAVEEVLLEFMAIPTLALLVTMRGTQRPAPSAGWSAPLLPPLHSLHFEDAANVFRAIAGEVDEFAEEMIREVDCIPLAVTLLGHMVQEENETTATLARRWKNERTGLIDTGGEDRLSKLDASIQCSISSPRMCADPFAASVLALLSVLPDGFPDREGLADRLQNYLPPEVNLHRAVSTLKRVALVHNETLVETPRIRLLSPVRHFSKANLHIPPPFRTALVNFYIQLLEEGRDHADPRAHVIPPELLNIQSVFTEAFASGDNRLALIKASITYTEWLVFMGSGVDDIIKLAIRSSPTSELLPACYFWLGRLCVRRNDADGAHDAFRKAIQLHVEAHDTAGEANDLYELGSLYVHWGKLEAAEASFKQALQLHTAERNYLGEGYDLLELGKLFMRAGQLKDAEVCMTNALNLLRATQHVVGQARALRRLAGVFMRQERLEEAESALYEAVRLHRQTKSILGEAHDLRRLGNLHLWRHQLEEAEVSFNKAADLHRQAHDLLGEANDLASMSEVCMELGRLSEAESYLTYALRLHEQTQGVMGQANDLQSLGELYARKRQLPEAEKALSRAVQLHQQVGEKMGCAKDKHKLGCLYLRMGALGTAEEAFKDAICLYRQVSNQAGEIEGLHSLANLYAKVGNRKAEEEVLKSLSALKLVPMVRFAATGEEVVALRVPRDLDMMHRLEYWSGYSP
ncbi:Tetratricopeptide repeat protein 28 [Mycena indigotica]|uniref:Tetratricopeptide repeat protein 28 n=1 Tax=Mycena indigotica TaxID=2126181 RepID=A0A8H6SS09_9AGAR|nr:Tetratricopeptide repeat protein 28 [Mycena indigotica]KAF7303832.1 Tetratricopeptide repeat protein 28 [Mycena indigotica]